MKNKKPNFIKSGAFFLFVFSLLLPLCNPVLAQTEPLAGTTTATNDISPEAELMAYIAISKASDQIAKNVCSSFTVPGQTYKVAVYNDDVKNQIINYRNNINVLNSIESRFNAAIPKDDPLTAAIDESKMGLTDAFLIEAESLAINTSGGGQKAARPVLGEADNIAAGLTSINGAMGALLDLVGFFKTNIKDTGFKLSATKEQLLPEIVNQLKIECTGKTVEFYTPKEIPFSLNAPNSNLLATLERLYSLRIKAESGINKIDGMRLAYNNRLVAIQTAETASTAADDAINSADDAIIVAKLESKPADEKKARLLKAKKAAEKAMLALKIATLRSEANTFRTAYVANEGTKNELEAIIKQFDAVVSALVKTTDSSPTPLLLSLFEAEIVADFAKTPSNYVLEVAPNVAGSTRRIKQNLFLDLFITTGRVSYNGAAVIRYTLFQNQGTIEKACVVKTYVDFRKMSSLKNAEKNKEAVILNNCQTP